MSSFKRFRKVLSTIISFSFLFTSILPPNVTFAQTMPSPLLALPAPGAMLAPSAGFTPTIIRGVTVDPVNPLNFKFIVDTGDAGLEGQAFEDETKKLVKYFLATITTPEDQLWVNLSPYESDRIIPEDLGVTQMGVDLLAQDYILKQLTASLIYPENELGKSFWNKIYKKAHALYGTTEIPVNTFNKVWIVPNKAVVYEHEGSAFVVKQHLKVMLEEDYVAMSHMQDSRHPEGATATEGSQIQWDSSASPQNDVAMDDKKTNKFASEIIREVIIPALEAEVNEGENFANLRQIYNSMILATWYKNNLKQTLLNQVYADQNKTKGVDVADRDTKLKIYDQYVEAFKKGTYDYIKEEYDPVTSQVIPRKYFSGGAAGVTGKQVEVDKLEGPITAQPPAVQAAVATPAGTDREVEVTLVENAGDGIEGAFVSSERNRVNDTRNWLNGPYFERIAANRPWTAEDIASVDNVNNQPLTWQNQMAAKFRDRLAAVHGTPNGIFTGGVMDGSSAAKAVEAGAQALYFSGWQASHHWGEPDLARYPYTQVPEVLARITNYLRQQDEAVQVRFRTLLKGGADKTGKAKRGIEEEFDAFFRELRDGSAIDQAKWVNAFISASSQDLDIFVNAARNNPKEIFSAIFTPIVEQAIAAKAELFGKNDSQGKRDDLRNAAIIALRAVLLDYLIPIYVDADAGHQAVPELQKLLIQAGATASHWEDQLHGEKKCGHMAGKVLVSIREHYRRLLEARKTADSMRSLVSIVARTDAEAAKLLASNEDARDHYFIKGTTKSNMPSLSYAIRLSRREVDEYDQRASTEGVDALIAELKSDMPGINENEIRAILSAKTPEQLVEEMAAEFPELAQAIRDVWAARGISEGKRIEVNDIFKFENGIFAADADQIWSAQEAIESNERSLKLDTVLVAEDGTTLTVQEIINRKPKNLAREVAITQKLSETWGKLAQTKTYAKAVEDHILNSKEGQFATMDSAQRERIVGQWHQATDPLTNTLSNEQQRALAKQFGVEIFWDWDKARTYEGYYQIDSTIGAINAAVRARVYARIADIVWMEQANPDVDQGGRFIANVNADPRANGVFHAINLSPSFNWSNPDVWPSLTDEQKKLVKELQALPDFDITNPGTWHVIDGRTDVQLNPSNLDTWGPHALAVQAMMNAIDTFSQELAKKGNDFQFVTIFQDHTSSRAMYAAFEQLVQRGAGGFVRHVQQQEQKAKDRFVTHQTYAGVPRVTANQEVVRRGSSATGAAGKDSTEAGFGSPKVETPQAPKPADATMVLKERLTFRQDSQLGNLAQAYPDVYTPIALNVLDKFQGRSLQIQKRLAGELAEDVARAERREDVGFLPETNSDGSDYTVPGMKVTVKQARAGDFQGAPVQAKLKKVGITITGPTTRDGATLEESLRSIAYQLLSGAEYVLWDGEDSLGQLNNMSLDGIRNMKLALSKDPIFMKVVEEVAKDLIKKGKKPQDWDWKKLIDENYTTPIYRVRGLHLNDRHLKYKFADGREVAVSATIADLILYMTNVYETLLGRGDPLAIYMPKLQSAQDAALLAEILDDLEATLEYKGRKLKDIPLEDGKTGGIIKVLFLIENVKAAMQAMEIRAALGRHGSLINTARWDYLATVIKAKDHDKDWVLDDFSLVGMTHRLMAKFENTVWRAANTPDRDGNTAIFEGGMEVQIPTIPDDIPQVEKDKYINVFMATARANKEREAKAGAIRAWVAHPDMVDTVASVFKGLYGENGEKADVLNQKRNLAGVEWTPLTYTAEDAAEFFALADLDKRQITVAGLREDVSVSMQYTNNVLVGRGAASIKPADFFGIPSKPFLMEDRATLEGRDAGIRKRVRVGVAFTQDDPELGIKAGDRLTKELLSKIIEEEFYKLHIAPNRIVFDSSKETTLRISRTALEKFVFSDVTIPWAVDLESVALGINDPAEAERQMDAYIDGLRESNNSDRKMDNPLFVAAPAAPKPSFGHSGNEVDAKFIEAQQGLVNSRVQTAFQLVSEAVALLKTTPMDALDRGFPIADTVNQKETAIYVLTRLKNENISTPAMNVLLAALEEGKEGLDLKIVVGYQPTEADIAAVEEGSESVDKALRTPDPTLGRFGEDEGPIYDVINNATEADIPYLLMVALANDGEVAKSAKDKLRDLSEWKGQWPADPTLGLFGEDEGSIYDVINNASEADAPFLLMVALVNQGQVAKSAKDKLRDLPEWKGQWPADPTLGLFGEDEGPIYDVINNASEADAPFLLMVALVNQGQVAKSAKDKLYELSEWKKSNSGELLSAVIGKKISGRAGIEVDAQFIEAQAEPNLGPAMLDMDFFPPETAAKPANVGGIDLNPAMLDLQIKRDGNGVPLPLPMQPVESFNIQGFAPVIINVAPINVPFLLGMDTTTDTNKQADTDTGLDKFTRDEKAINKIEELSAAL